MGIGCLAVVGAAAGCSITSGPSEVVGRNATFGQVFNACQNIEGQANGGDEPAQRTEITEFKACLATADKLLMTTTTTEGK